MTVDGDLISRCEFFDEADLDAALARFDELSRRRRAWKTQQAEWPSASGALRGPRLGRYGAAAGRDSSTDDRRRVVNRDSDMVGTPSSSTMRAIAASHEPDVDGRCDAWGAPRPRRTACRSSTHDPIRSHRDPLHRRDRRRRADRGDRHVRPRRHRRRHRGTRCPLPRRRSCRRTRTRGRS